MKQENPSGKPIRRWHSVKRGVQVVVEGAEKLLFTPRCVGCHTLLPPFAPLQTVFCPLCRTKWETACTSVRTEVRAEAAAESPAESAAEMVDNSVLNGADKHIYVVPYHSGQTDGVPERVIYHLKHQGEKRVFRMVSEALAPRVRAAVDALSAEAETDKTACGEGRTEVADPTADARPAVPVLVTYPPRRRSAVREDGFDQAARLAQGVASACGYEHATLLVRTRHRIGGGEMEQKTLDAAARRDNAAHAYRLSADAPERVQGAVVLLCDDLCTTGATLRQCGELLHAAGARAVVWVTVAQTTGSRSEKGDS